MANFPLLSIPLYYMLISYPHAHAVFGPGKAAFKQRNDANPHGQENLASIKKRLSPRDFAAYERAEGCHRNGLENMPLFVAAIFAGFLAEQKAGVGSVGLGTFALWGLVVRVGYTFSYLMIEDKSWALVRTAFYNVGVFWAFTVIVRAAMKLG